MPVYEPREDSFFMAEFLKKNGKLGTICVDVGTGSGILTETLAEKCDVVVASDISREALSYAKARMRKNNVFFVLGNLMDFVKRCDAVVFNAPYLSREEGEGYDIATHHQMPDGRDVLEEFIKSLSCTDFKRAYLLTSTQTDRTRMENAIHAHKMKAKVVARKRIFFEELVIEEITK